LLKHYVFPGRLGRKVELRRSSNRMQIEAGGRIAPIDFRPWPLRPIFSVLQAFHLS